MQSDYKQQMRKKYFGGPATCMYVSFLLATALHDRFRASSPMKQRRLSLRVVFIFILLSPQLIIFMYYNNHPFRFEVTACMNKCHVLLPADIESVSHKVGRLHWNQDHTVLFSPFLDELFVVGCTCCFAVSKMAILSITLPFHNLF